MSWLKLSSFFFFFAVFMRRQIIFPSLLMPYSCFAGTKWVFPSRHIKTGWWRRNCHQVFPLCLTQSTSRGSIEPAGWHCSATPLKTGITVTWMPFTWRKFHGVCHTPSGPLPNLCYSVATNILVVCPSSMYSVPLLISSLNEIFCWRPVAAVPYILVCARNGWKTKL